MDVKKISLKCENCGGILSVEEGKSVLVCPYCGHKTLIMEDDAVTIEKIRSSAHKEIELEKIKSNDRQQQMADEKEKRKETKEEVEAFKKGKLFKLLIIAVVLAILFVFYYFAKGKIGAGIFASIQAICFGAAWCMGMQIIREKKRYIHVLVAIAGILLIVPTVRACGARQSGELVKDWNVLFLSDVIPEPGSNKYDIDVNTEKEMMVEALNISSEDYYEYISACKASGYNIEIEEGAGDFLAYNGEGYCLELSHNSSKKEMKIHVEAPMETSELDWYKHAVSEMLPEPKSTVGAYVIESDNETKVKVAGTSRSDYEEYIEQCIAWGYADDFNKGDKHYSAYDAERNHLYLNYEGNNVMVIDIHKAKEDQPDEAENESQTDAGEGESQPVTEETDLGKEEGKVENESKAEETSTASESTEKGIRSDFKNAMDSYENFISEYCDIMQKFAESDGTDLKLLQQYMDYLDKYSDYVEAFDEWSGEDMNEEELAYYLEVQARVTQKLLGIAIE